MTPHEHKRIILTKVTEVNRALREYHDVINNAAYEGVVVDDLEFLPLHIISKVGIQYAIKTPRIMQEIEDAEGK